MRPLGCQVLECCLSGDLEGAKTRLMQVWDQGYAASDIIGTIFRVRRDETLLLRVHQGISYTVVLLS